jgi:VWFA-related protein
MHARTHVALYAAALMALAVAATEGQSQQTAQPPAGGGTSSGDQAFRFKSGVELVNVTATVTDANGRFVPNLKQDDFLVYEDNEAQPVTHFSAERVPVSLGIALDTSGSMAGDKIKEAQTALNNFLYELQDPGDEFFLYRFSNGPLLLQSWTSDRALLARALGRATPNGGTAMYDAVAQAIPLAQQGQNRKKALVVISDGNDTTSRTDIRDLKQQIRQSEVLVYAVGIDGEGEPIARRPTPQPPRIPIPIPLPFPGAPRGRGGRFPQLFPPAGGTGGGNGGGWPRGRSSDRVNVAALRDMTDDSGGRTEIVRGLRDLDPATAGIADELSKQYYLGYA